MLESMNTLRKGSVRYLVFKEAAIWYAVALDFNIVETSDDPRNALVQLFDAIAGYVEAAKKIKGGRVSHLLNQEPELEYERMWRALSTGKAVRSPYHVHTFGITTV